MQPPTVWRTFSSSNFFQRAMEGIHRDSPSTVVYIDDVLITGKTQEDHLKNLDLVLSWLEKEGLLLSREKCSFMLLSVKYLTVLFHLMACNHQREKFGQSLIHPHLRILPH